MLVVFQNAVGCLVFAHGQADKPSKRRLVEWKYFTFFSLSFPATSSSFSLSESHTHTHTHIDALLSCHRDSSGSCQISHSGVTQQRGVHVTSQPTHTRVHTHTHRLFYFGPLLLARHDFFAFVRRRHGRSHPEYPKLIHSTDELCGNFLPFHKPDSWAGPQQQQQQRHRTHSPAAIKRLFECLHGLQSIQSLLFAWVDLFTGLPIKERRRLYSLYIIVKLIAFCLSCDVENGWSCQRTGFFFPFYCHFFIVFWRGWPFPACWSREKERVFFLLFYLVVFCFFSHLTPLTPAVWRITLICFFEYLLSKQLFICRDLTVGHGRATARPQV